MIEQTPAVILAKMRFLARREVGRTPFWICEGPFRAREVLGFRCSLMVSESYFKHSKMRAPVAPPPGSATEWRMQDFTRFCNVFVFEHFFPSSTNKYNVCQFSRHGVGYPRT